MFGKGDGDEFSTRVHYVGFSPVVFLDCCPPSDIVDIKPANMEELTEVITAAECHPHQCNVFVYSSSKGTIRLCDMRAAALCDRHSKCELLRITHFSTTV